MNVLELFAGSRSFGKNAEKLGHSVFSVDWEKYDGVNFTAPDPVVVPTPEPVIAPTKQELMAQLAALSAQIQALE